MAALSSFTEQVCWDRKNVMLILGRMPALVACSEAGGSNSRGDGVAYLILLFVFFACAISFLVLLGECANQVWKNVNFRGEGSHVSLLETQQFHLKALFCAAVQY